MKGRFLIHLGSKMPPETIFMIIHDYETIFIINSTGETQIMFFWLRTELMRMSREELAFLFLDMIILGL